MSVRFQRIAVVSLAMALALIGISAPSASAALITCPYEDTGADWYGTCYRYTDDGDAGGVSGSADIRKWQNGSGFASIDFEAKGEVVEIKNQAGWHMDYTVEWYNGSEWVIAMWRTLQPGVSATWNLSIAEDKLVRIRIRGASSQRLYVSNDTLKS
ncbi:hypothetical protein [Streptomyces sp. NPDC001508]|uniref:hypothetical protein n=1 Tax=Streptomyces sp. NPDC001508 TaxID=3154656 RepID=UPI0033228061